MIAADRAEILRTLQVLGEPGQVFELRALDAVTPGWRRPHTVAGYFDDPAKLAAEAARIQAAAGLRDPQPGAAGAAGAHLQPRQGLRRR